MRRLEVTDWELVIDFHGPALIGECPDHPEYNGKKKVIPVAMLSKDGDAWVVNSFTKEYTIAPEDVNDNFRSFMNLQGYTPESYLQEVFDRIRAGMERH